MAERDNGGPAFPIAGTPDRKIDNGYIIGAPGWGGMSLRDYFAGQALPNLISSAMDTKDSAWPVTVDEIVGKSYQYADAMLAERAKGGG